MLNIYFDCILENGINIDGKLNSLPVKGINEAFDVVGRVLQLKGLGDVISDKICIFHLDKSLGEYIRKDYSNELSVDYDNLLALARVEARVRKGIKWLDYVCKNVTSSVSIYYGDGVEMEKIVTRCMLEYLEEVGVDNAGFKHKFLINDSNKEFHQLAKSLGVDCILAERFAASEPFGMTIYPDGEVSVKKNRIEAKKDDRVVYMFDLV